VSRAPFNPHLLAFGGLVAMAAAIGIGRFIFTPILPPMVDDLGLSKGQAGLIAAANFAGYLVGALAATGTSGVRNPRLWLLVALALSAVTTGWMALTHVMAEFLVWRFVGGVASAYVLVLASALVLERLSATGHGALSAIHFSGVGTGIALSAALTWMLAASGYDWRAMWLTGGALALAAVVAVAFFVSPSSSAAVKPSGEASAKQDRRLRLLTAAYGLFGFGYIITATFIVAIVRGSAEAAPFEPIFWLVLGLAAIPSVTLWVAAGRVLGIMPAFAVACLVEAVGVFASVASTGVASLVLASALLGGTFMGLTALGLIAARDLAPNHAGRWVGILTSAFGVGQIVGPPLAGFGFDLTGSFFLPSMLAVAALCVSAYLALAISRLRPA
jgi:predicted MFS family arabinose efflux permease